MRYSNKQRTRFWSNVTLGDADNCWLWKRSINSTGYGQVALTVDNIGRILKAHKVAWEMKHDATIAPGVRATHTCGERLCCNPAHILLIAPAPADDPQRIEPTTSQARGERHGMSKLTDKQVALIKYRLSALSTREIADMLGIGYHAVWDIRQGNTWSHI